MMRVAHELLPTCMKILPTYSRRAGGGCGVLRALAAGALLCTAAALPLIAAAPSALAQGYSEETRDTGGSAPSAFPQQPGGMFGTPQKLDETLPLYLQGDELIYDTSGNRVIARGNVEIYYNKNILTADQVIYDQGANTLTASGNVELKEANGNVIRADAYTLTDDFRDGFVQSLSVVTRDDSRITAARGERREGNVTEFSEATFTACKSDGNVPPLWCVGARRIIHDQQAATIRYQDAEFKVLGTTIAYLPYFEHPDPSVKRKSGFLAPSYGNSDELGIFVELPYYFALSPHYDFTFRPRYMSDQGVLWQGDWRQKLANGEYSITFAAIDQDWTKLPSGNPNAQDLDGWRGSIETRGRFSLSSWWSYGWNATFESDDNFRRFYKLDSLLLTDRVNDIWLEGISDRNYFSAKLYHFESLLYSNDGADSLVHPVIDHNYVFRDPVLGGELSWKSHALSLSRSDVSVGTNSISQDMNRFVTEVKWRRRFTDAVGITYTPFGELRGDIYQVNYTDFPDPLNPGMNLDDTFLRGLATGGATVSYPWVANVGSTSHVIEPIGQIVTHNASAKQEGLPNEDAKSLVFDDTNLFDTNKFSGYDRFETGTRANVGVQYTFQGPVGYARVLAGQSFHLSGENAYDEDSIAFGSRSGLETKSSDYVLGFYLAPTDIFRVIAQSRFDEDDLTLRRQELAATFTYGPLALGTSYTYTNTNLLDETIGPTNTFLTEQDISAYATLRLTDRWSLSGSMRYDLERGARLYDSITLAYLDECFMLSATYSETFIEDVYRDIRPDQVVMLRFELKHLGGFNYQTNVVDFMGGEDATAYRP